MILRVGRPLPTPSLTRGSQPRARQSADAGSRDRFSHPAPEVRAIPLATDDQRGRATGRLNLSEARSQPVGLERSDRACAFVAPPGGTHTRLLRQLWKSRHVSLPPRGFRLQDQPPRRASAPPLSAA